MKKTVDSQVKVKIHGVHVNPGGRIEIYLEPKVAA